MTYIYLDVLLITNVYVNYFLLKATAKITHTQLKLSRCIISAFLGSLSSLVIVIPKLNMVYLMPLKVLFALTIIKVAFASISVKRLVKLGVVFFVVSFIFTGINMIACELTKTSAIIVNNHSVYYNISIMTLIISTIVAYIAVCACSMIFDRYCNISHSYKVSFELSGKRYELCGISDTGNSLIDSFSGKPVIICSSGQLNSALNLNPNSVYGAEDYLNLLKGRKGLRLLPYSTISSSGVLPAFSADKIAIKNEKNEEKYVDAFIGISSIKSNCEEAVFNPRLLI